MENTLTTPQPSRPEGIVTILNSLDRFNAEKIPLLQEYVREQCKSGEFDIEANLALLKLYQFNNQTSDEDTILSILAMGLVRFYASDFTLSLHLLPCGVLGDVFDLSSIHGNKGTEAGDAAAAAAGTTPATPSSSGNDSLSEAVQRLSKLYALLDSSRYTEFWELYDSDDENADSVCSVEGFEDLLRDSIARTISFAATSVPVTVLQGWANISGNKFNEWVSSSLGWQIKDDVVVIPSNEYNTPKTVVTNESVYFDQLSRIIKKGFEIK